MNGLARSGLILGIIACSLNALFVFAPIGFICGVIGLIFGCITYAKRRIGSSGIWLGVFSIIMVAVWVGSISAVVQLDETFYLPF